MKLATLKDGSRDGTLIVVARDLRHAIKADHIAPCLRDALDDWRYCAPQLEQLYNELNAAPGGRAFELDLAQLMAPLPRAAQFADASSYLIHAELIRKSRKTEIPPWWKTDALMYQGCADPFLGPCDDIVANEAHGIDLEMELAVVLDDVPMGVERDKAAAHIVLFMLLNDVSLRELVPQELAKGFGFFQSKPPSSLSPVAVTPDELGEAWDGRRLHGAVRATVNGELLGEPDAGKDMQFDFPRLIAHAARTRPLPAGTVIGTGTVSNRNRKTGAGCLFERRAEEILEGGKPVTPYLKDGDRVRIEMRDAAGHSIFGAIDQCVRGIAQPARPAKAASSGAAGTSDISDMSDTSATSSESGAADEPAEPKAA